jgi:hypothetical protein
LTRRRRLVTPDLGVTRSAAWWTAIKVGFVCSVVARVALAQAPPSDEESAERRADTAFRRGVAFASEGDFAAAISEFESAQALSPHPSVLFNLVQAYSRTGRPVEAVETAKTYLSLDAGVSPERRAQVDALLALNEARMGWVTVTPNVQAARVLIDGRDVRVANDGRIALAAGSHALAVTAPGHVTFVSSFAVEARKTAVLTPALEELPARVLGAPPTSDAAVRGPSREVAAPAGASSTGASWGVGLMIGGGAALAAGVVTYVVNSNAFEDWKARKSDWASTPPSWRDPHWSAQGSELDEELDELHAIDRLAVALAAAGAASAVTGLVLYVTAPAAPRTARITVSPLGRFAAFEGTF